MHKYKLQGKKGEGTFSEVRATRAHGAPRRRRRPEPRVAAPAIARPPPSVAPSNRRRRAASTIAMRCISELATQVLKGTSVKTGKPVAIKCMKHVFDNVEQVNALREIQALKRLSPHPNIVKLYEVL